VTVTVIVLLSFADLRDRGIKFTRQHIHRLIRKRQFPAPVKLGVGEGSNAWVESEIDEFIKARIAARDMIQQLTSEKKKAGTG
jgi:prophage regulatory protein